MNGATASPPPNRVHVIADLAACENEDDRSTIVKKYFDDLLEAVIDDTSGSKRPIATFTMPLVGDTIQANLNGSDDFVWMVTRVDQTVYSQAYPRTFSKHMFDFKFSLERSGETLDFVALDLTEQGAFFADIVSCNGYIYTFQEASIGGKAGRSGKCYHVSSLRNMPTPQKAMIKPVRYFDTETGRCFEYVFEFLPPEEGLIIDLTVNKTEPPSDKDWDIGRQGGKGVKLNISRRVHHPVPGIPDCKTIRENFRTVSFDSTGRLVSITNEEHRCHLAYMQDLSDPKWHVLWASD